MDDNGFNKGLFAPCDRLFGTTEYRCSEYVYRYLRHVNTYAVAVAYQSVYPVLFIPRYVYRKTKWSFSAIMGGVCWFIDSLLVGLQKAYLRMLGALGLSIYNYRREDIIKIWTMTSVPITWLLACLVPSGYLYTIIELSVLSVLVHIFSLSESEFEHMRTYVLKMLETVRRGIVEVGAILVAALSVPVLIISLPFVLLHATLLTIAASMRGITSLTLEFIRDAYQVTAEWIRNVRLLTLPGKALSFLWKMLKSLLLACLCLGIHPVEEDVYDLTALPEQSSDKNSQYGFLRNVIAVSIGAVVAVVAGVFSIAATLVSLLALPIVLLGFTLFNHPDVSCDRESSPRAGRLAICFDTSNVPPEPRNPEFIQRIATYVVNAANTAQSRHATTQPANEDINVAAEAQRPGIGERVQRAISMIAQAFSSSNTQPDTGAPSAICFGVESVSQGLATEPLQR
ncbi:hypothetical protein [Anaplasma phagocytophilum]|uniref:Uncharacterized protein n=2 Tax=Anaplasma phagocytophilum TaxID=948 RepID=S6G5R1_ANAPH|nr:hypothetical protein [Anaplasma phagocytophilum]EOA62365.1 hypothetical protein CRT38_03832 [Anaplasma phagocytophilum str. CRT38]KDB57336.1 hypothetical protein P030_05470 [Anaplasma phagocytophilum str. CRT35]KJV83876.1 putative membrane protein [Anaplasma phagocytophilum str. CRT53-1]